MNKDKLQTFLLKARTKTYASGGGKITPALSGSTQLEFKELDWLYRDVYFIGNGIFMGLETVYYQEKPVYSVSYFGNFKQITEEETDSILRKALMENWDKTRLWNNVEWKFENYKYTCEANGNIDEIGGTEKIFKDGKEVYYFYFAGGLID